MSEEIRLCLRLKSGKEFHFSCEKYTITRSKETGELLEFTYEGAFGECPQYFSINDVESISRINMAEPKTGKWETDFDRWGDIETSVNGYRCSECGEFDPCKDNYCPNCGAMMLGEDGEA